MKRFVVGLLLLTLLSLPAAAGAIIASVDTADPGAIGSLAIDFDVPGDVAAVAFYLPQTYSGVQVRVHFADLTGVGTYLAYLTNGIGSQATVDNEIASTTFTAPFMTPDWVMIWNDVTIPQGFTYLTIGAADSSTAGGWSATTDPITTFNGGAFQGDLSGVQYYATGADVNAAYLPASNFAVDTDLTNGQLMYDITTPEPSTLSMAGLALVALAVAGRRVSRRQS